MAYTTEHRKQLAKEWSARLVDQESSQVSIPVYCQQHRLSPRQFRYWKRKLQTSPTSSSRNFVRVTSQASPSESASRLIFPQGMVLETSSLPSPAWLREVVSFLGGSSC
jgi:hypothetical protein